MARPSWHLDRRTFLRGARTVVGLALARSDGESRSACRAAEAVCAFFFGNGVAIPKQDSSDAEEGWSWFPRTGGSDYTLDQTARTTGPLPERHVRLWGNVASLQSPAGRSQHRRRLAGGGRYSRQPGELDLAGPAHRPPGRVPTRGSPRWCFPVTAASATRADRPRSPSMPRAASPRRVGSAPALFERLFGPRERGPRLSGKGVGLRTAPGGFPARGLALAALTTWAGPINGGWTNSSNHSARSIPDFRAPRTGWARPCRRSIVARSTSTSLRAGRRTTFAPCST